MVDNADFLGPLIERHAPSIDPSTMEDHFYQRWLEQRNNSPCIYRCYLCREIQCTFSLKVTEIENSCCHCGGEYEILENTYHNRICTKAINKAKKILTSLKMDHENIFRISTRIDSEVFLGFPFKENLHLMKLYLKYLKGELY